MLDDIMIGLISTALWEAGRHLYILFKKNPLIVSYDTILKKIFTDPLITSQVLLVTRF